MKVTPGSTDVSTYFNLENEDGTPATGVDITTLDLQYVRSGASPAAKVDATALAGANSSHADNQAVAVDDTDQPGLHRVDWPDAAFAAGVREVVLSVNGAGLRPAHLRVQLETIQTGDAYAVVNHGTHGNAALQTLIAAIKAKTDNLPADPADASDIAAALAALNDISAADVNAQVLDVLNVDTWTEITGVPGYSVSLVAMVRRLYASLINPLDQTASKKTFRSAAGVAQWEKDAADDGTTYTESAGNAP